MSAASSGVARGITPGSLKLVRNNVAMTNINNSTPTSGIANVISLAKYTQLKIHKRLQLNLWNQILRFKGWIHDFQNWRGSSKEFSVFVTIKKCIHLDPPVFHNQRWWM